jgi:preprotein translocase subunit Sec63
MEFTDYLWLKLGLLCVAAFVYQFFFGPNARKGRQAQSEQKEAPRPLDSER